MQSQHTHKTADAILGEFLAGNCGQQSTPKRHFQASGGFFKAPNSATTPKAAGKKSPPVFTVAWAPPRGHSNASNIDNQPGLDSASLLGRLQSKLVAFLFVYATIIIALLLIYSFHQQAQLKRLQHQQAQDSSAGQLSSPVSNVLGAASELSAAANPSRAQQVLAETGSNAALEQSDSAQQQIVSLKLTQELEAKFESKLNLLERYIEVLALDLEEAKERLREREKCACSQGCSFNGTRFSDGQKWHQKCDLCTCQSGKISCLPRECPKLPANCKQTVQRSDQCCPICMKQCKINKTIVRHGELIELSQMFNDASVGAKLASRKRCKCHDGLIKCELLARTPSEASASGALEREGSSGPPALREQPLQTVNKTAEYLRAILGGMQLEQPMSADKG